MRLALNGVIASNRFAGRAADERLQECEYDGDSFNIWELYSALYAGREQDFR